MSAPHTVFISGPPGVGKTACLETLCELPNGSGVDVYSRLSRLGRSDRFMALQNTSGELDSVGGPLLHEMTGLSENALGRVDNQCNFVTVQQITTRLERLNAMMSGESDGKRHVSPQDFHKLANDGMIIGGWCNASRNYYGFDKRELMATAQMMAPHQTLLLEVNPLNPNLQSLFGARFLKNCGWLGFSASHSYTLTQALARDQGITGFEYESVESFLRLPKILSQLRDGGYSTQFDTPGAAHRLLEDVAKATQYNMDGFNAAYFAYINKMRELKDKGKMHRMVEFSWKDRGRIFDTVADTVESLVRHPRTPEGGISIQQRAAGDREAVLSARFNWHRRNSINKRDHSHRLPSEGEKAVAQILQKKIAKLQAECHWHDVQEAVESGGMPARWRR